MDSNIYAYVGGNPISLIDPSGLEPSINDTLRQRYLWETQQKNYGAAVCDFAKKYATAAEFILGSLIGVPEAKLAREITLVDGFYQAENSAFKFSQYYYEKLWSTGRGAPFIQAEEVLSTAKNFTADRMAGFNRYVNGAMEMVYNPTTKEVWHIMPKK